MGNRYISIELNFLDKEAFYSLFKTISGITEEQKREIVDSLFQALDISRRNRLVRYRNGEFTAKSESGNKARSDQQILQKQYLREIKKIYDGYSFYDAFLDFPEVSIYRKKLIIDSILAKLSDEQRDNVIRALKKEILIKDVPSLRAILRRVKSQYESLIKRNLYGRNIYNILPDINGIGNEKKMEIADKLFSRFSLERQENMLRLLALEINSSSESGHMAYQDLDIYKRQYNRYIEDRIVG